MGLFKKVFRPIRKIAKKIIPKEVRPFLPYIATAFGPAAGGIMGLTAQEAAKKLALKGIIAGSTAAATDEDANVLRTAALAAAPAAIGRGITQAVPVDMFQDAESLAKFTTGVEKLTAPTVGNQGVGSVLKLAGAQTAIDQKAKLTEINQDDIDKYNENLRKQGVLDKTKRRTAIFGIYQNAGYDDSYINNMLDRYGLADGGLTSIRAGYKDGKKVTTMEDLISGLNKDDDDDDDFNDFLMTAKEGVEMAYKTPGPKPVQMLKFARGGEVEIEEETDDLGIMDLMRDQGIEYGEQVSAPGPKDGYDDIARQLFGKGYKDLTPEELEMFQEELERLMNKFRSGMDDEGIMQMASGYKDDIEEMYEQYVFEMEEQGLTPMSFSDFLRQARAGMADGGIMEKDMRGGGFIPEGTKERADDVPARLSKNEFVMTADAVRAAGGGSVNKGAKRMYDMMYNLEGKV